jgi:hypothetical protein
LLLGTTLALLLQKRMILQRSASALNINYFLGVRLKFIPKREGAIILEIG